MRVGCIFVPHLPVQVERIAKRTLQGRPVVIGGLLYEGKSVYDASCEAIACGVRVGMPLRQASVLCPEARFLPADVGRYQEVFGEMLSLLGNFSPVAEPVELGCAYFDVTGVRGERELATEIAEAVYRELGLRAQLGVASGKFVARTAAMLAVAGNPIIVESGEEAGFLAPLRIDILPCSMETKARLCLLGVRLVGKLAAFSKEALISQFGKEGELLYNLAHGIDNAPLVPRRTPEVLVKSIHLDMPVSTLSEVTAIVRKAVEGIAAELKKRWQVCRKVTLRLVSTSGIAVEETFNLKQPTSSAEKILLRLESGLARLKLQEDVVEFTLSFEIEADRGNQLKLLKDAKRSPLDEVWTEFLKRKRVYSGLKRVKPGDRHALLPEEHYRLVDICPSEV